MSKGIDNILKRSGTGQPQRFLKALDPATFDLHDFTIEDWLLFAYNFAKNVNYFDTSNDKKPSNDWQCFFTEFNKKDQVIDSRTTKEYGKLKDSINELLSDYKKSQELTPHLTLFVCFLQLLELSKDRFNKLTKRHLDFYYKEILQVDKLAPIPDQVHVLFELARRSTEEQVAEETELNGDKDKNGADRIYKTEEEIIVNQAKITSLKTVYNGKKFSDPKKQGDNPFEFKASQVANTLDGLEEPLLEESPYWYPFGYTSDNEDYTELENAEVGFAISSPMLELHEGQRKVILTIDFKSDEDGDPKFAEKFTQKALQEVISIYGSGEEDWIGPLQLKVESSDDENEDDDDNEEIAVISDAEEIEVIEVSDEAKGKQLKLTFELTPEEDALVNYNSEFLIKKYDTKSPVVRFVINTGKGLGYNFYKALSKKVVEKINIRVEVEDARTVIAENDNGTLKTVKPFYPFTPQPLVGSNFSVNYPEAFSKKWQDFNVRFTWKNAPTNFQTWYSAYMNSQKTATTKAKYEKDAIGGTGADTTKIVTGNDYFKADKSIYHEEVWKGIEDSNTEDETDDSVQILFTNIKDSTDFECLVKYENTEDYTVNKTGPVRLSLKQSFLHELYPRLYAIALISKEAAMPIPNEPYTPIAENISISYTAEEEIKVSPHILSETLNAPVADENTEESFINRRIQLFHEHPFGFAEEHNHLKINRARKGIRDVYDGNEINTYLVPKYCSGGQLFIGIESLEPLQSVSMLIQVLEGSENPIVPSFEENENVDWAVLCSNGWKDMKEHIIANNSNNFLSSGIIKMSIPRDATSDNTLLPENLIWIKAEIRKTYDAVCKVMDIHTQAVVAKFDNRDNEVSHLESGLPEGTIKKLITRVPQIKSLSQPYSSFGGVAEESDHNFYRRISERLRHKNRAITLWDYEHLILQKYPKIYKVKCLNHTSEKSFSAPGEVTIVAIPDTVNKNVFDIYEPRLSKGLLNKVQEYINTLNSMHVDAKVINPNYEKVTVKLEVQFYEGYDKSFYSKKLEEDITKFLSPWAFDDTKEVEFGITLHKSVLIDYLEKLDYVDYLQNVNISKGKKGESKNNISPSDPKSILVSAKEHQVSTVLSNCQGTPTEPEKECQV